MSVSTACLNHFAALIKKELGIVYAAHNFYQLEVRLVTISKQLGLESPESLLSVANSGKLPAASQALLLDMATNNETSFFRDAHVFQSIISLMQEHLAQAAQAGQSALRPYRVWSAACSSGQEVYSLAMAATEAGLTGKLPMAFLATDASNFVLKRAEAGAYSQLEVGRGLTPTQLSRFFDQDLAPPSDAAAAASSMASAAGTNAPTFKVKRELRSLISFRRLNLIAPWDTKQLGQFDMILCRNMLIYQTIESRCAIVKQLAAQLVPGGRLVLGGSESMIGISDLFTDTRIGKAIIFQLKSPAIRAAG